jgi:hypothetical protein
LIRKKSPQKSTGNTPRIKSKKLKLNKQTQPGPNGFAGQELGNNLMGVNMIQRRAAAAPAEFVINKRSKGQLRQATEAL